MEIDSETHRTAESLSVEIAAIMHVVHSEATLEMDSEIDRIWIRARRIQQAAHDIQSLAAALEVIVRRMKERQA